MADGAAVQAQRRRLADQQPKRPVEHIERADLVGMGPATMMVLRGLAGGGRVGGVRISGVEQGWHGGSFGRG
jgi:hypothetical protein